MSNNNSNLQNYQPINKIRIVTATALFDGHDASINIMRRLLQARGAEIIHLGHNRSAYEIVKCAVEEDAQAVAISSYQGGHVEFFKYIRDLLDQAGARDVKIFGGGGGVITPSEIAELEKYGITKIYSPEDGQRLGLPGIIGHMLQASDFVFDNWGSESEGVAHLARAMTLLEGKILSENEILAELGDGTAKRVPILGITGTGGAGKSSLTDELISRLLYDMHELRVGVLCIDPSKRKTGGALLGDRIRFNTCHNNRVYIRSFATRGSGKELANITAPALKIMKTQGFDLIVVETSGIGQGDAEILEVADLSLYVMTSEFGAATQLEKIDMLDFADVIAINKFERQGSEDAIRDVRTQLRRSRFSGQNRDAEKFPVFGTIASRFEDDGVNGLYLEICRLLNQHLGNERFKPDTTRKTASESSYRQSLIPAARKGYLGDIARCVRDFHKENRAQVVLCHQAEALRKAAEFLLTQGKKAEAGLLNREENALKAQMHEYSRSILEKWPETSQNYGNEKFKYTVRGKDIFVESRFTSLSQLNLPRVSIPRFVSDADTLKFLLSENLPGFFPFTGGLFPFRRKGEDPKRQFAGEGGPHRTNKRFHYLSENDEAKRLSTAFDSVTLYGAEPNSRPDIFGKVGESGVSIAHLDDMKELFKGFDLCSSLTSVSMTINGPAPIILAMFLNTAIDQQLEALEIEHGGEVDAEQKSAIRAKTLNIIRGTVQADILKEDQAQNTCIFSTEFALKLMGDMQEYFIRHKVRNYYSVSISGYHIAEAGANPITQLAFTLANGFTYVEYYLARGMNIDDFAPNLSFFFSNGLDPEYSVIGRVARRIWAVSMRDLYGASERSQKLKYHIQTSGRSLHAQEIDFNDIRTTLQALMALYDNCNSLHTNAYDEAITTPTEESVRRAMAIQLIIDRELGTNKCENINQGSFFLSELTDLVEEAVLQEFERLSNRGGVLGAMETQYQRNKIQEESLYYETLKDSGELPIIGVNTFLNPRSENEVREEIPLIRASYDEKEDQISRLNDFKNKSGGERDAALAQLAQSVIESRNVFEELMNTVRYASLGDITETLYKVGGKYRRSM